MRSIFISIQFLFIPLLAISNSYYVSNSGDDGNVGSEVFPFLTIQYGLNQVAPGDSLLVRDGIYNEALTWTTSGTSNNEIYLGAYSNEKPIVDGTSISDQVLLSINSKSYLKVHGLQFRNNYQQDAKGIYVLNEGTNITISNCQVYNIGWTTVEDADPYSVSPTGQAHGILVNGRTTIGISDIEIDNCHVYNIISGNSESLTLVGNVSEFNLEKDTVRDTKNIGIVVAGHYVWAVDSGVAAELNQSRNGSITNCLVYNNRRFSDVDAPAGIYVDGAKNVIVHGNTAYSNGNGFSIGCENAGSSADSIQVINNLSYNNDKAGIVFGSNSAILNASITKNNTIVHNGTLGNFHSEISLQNSSDCEILQNIIIPVSSSHYAVSIFGYTVTDLLVDNNLAYRYNDDVVNLFVPSDPVQFTETNTLISNPLFSDLSLFDFNLQSTSPAIDKGIIDYSIIKDTDVIDGERLINGKVDLGAHEHPYGGCPTVLTINSTYSAKGHFHATDSIIWKTTISETIDSIFLHTPISSIAEPMINLHHIIISSDACIE